MKKNVLFFIACLLTVAMFNNCNNASKATKTIENLKAAFKGESTASAKYAAYSLKAKEEGFSQVAVLFAAASKAEAIHANNHKEVLVKLNVTIEDIKPEFVVNSTVENVEDAIKGESYEFETMYPGFIKDAEAENVNHAKKSFTWALDTEKKHHEYYRLALLALQAHNIDPLPSEYFVCPKCGNTYDAETVKEKCDFCGTKNEKFIDIKG